MSFLKFNIETIFDERVLTVTLTVSGTAVNIILTCKTKHCDIYFETKKRWWSIAECVSRVRTCLFWLSKHISANTKCFYSPSSKAILCINFVVLSTFHWAAVEYHRCIEKHMINRKSPVAIDGTFGVWCF